MPNALELDFDNDEQSDNMLTVYDLLRLRCGLSQQEAADYHKARLDTVKSWCSGRRPAPKGVIDELRDLYRDIVEAGHSLAYLANLVPQADDNGDRVIRLGLPLSEKDAKVCGFPTVSACEAAVALAVAELPSDIPVLLVPRVRGAIPTAVTQMIGQNRVTVYHFKVWDPAKGEMVIPARKSPLERIESIGGEAIEETAERIDFDELDEYGRYLAAPSMPPDDPVRTVYNTLVRQFIVGLDDFPELPMEDQASRQLATEIVSELKARNLLAGA